MRKRNLTQTVEPGTLSKHGRYGGHKASKSPHKQRYESDRIMNRMRHEREMLIEKLKEQDEY